MRTIITGTVQRGGQIGYNFTDCNGNLQRIQFDEIKLRHKRLDIENSVTKKLHSYVCELMPDNAYRKVINGVKVIMYDYTLIFKEYIQI